MIALLSQKLTTLQHRMETGGLLRAYTLSGGVWFLLALLFSAEGYLVSAYRGSPQAWWPSFGYSLAIFSIWALVSPPVLRLVRQVEERGLPRLRRIGLYALGAIIINPLHVALFVLIFWPVYNDAGRIATRLDMGERMIVQNLHTNLIFYCALVLLGVGLHALRARQISSPGNPEPKALRLRTKGRVRLMAYNDISWIAAAGNYAEVHTAEGHFLTDDNLASVQARLPEDSFARIHRGHLVRLDAIAELKSLGRGDALVVLRDGTELRLSRRYRERLASLLQHSPTR
ncbi:LytR/AlgR family response regulator transcription factor [Kordiimonas sp.]|uniref:LytR/AlgR family response regulator transcription factor n=1 Tax=Kordiimonas sp. TaxID=1970157 RepID=UPI003A8DD2E0